MEVEVCIESTDKHYVIEGVGASYNGGASRIELCSHMQFDGLTPLPEHIRAARLAFSDRKGLVVMIRPCGGDFVYSPDELEKMAAQIQIAATEGADGVVLGVLRKGETGIDVDALGKLADTARGHGLTVTFHRAFDATSNLFHSLETLIDLNIDRVLTSGTPWGTKGTAADDDSLIPDLVIHACERIEIVIGGGVTTRNAPQILKRIAHLNGKISLHSFSGVQISGRTNEKAVAALVQAARN